MCVGGFYAFILSEYESRSALNSELAQVCEVAKTNSNRMSELEKKLDGVHLIRAELSGLKSVMSSMDRRLERFENFFLEHAK